MSSPLLDECNRFYSIGLIYENYATFIQEYIRKLGKYPILFPLHVVYLWGEPLSFTHLSAYKFGWNANAKIGDLPNSLSYLNLIH